MSFVFDSHHQPQQYRRLVPAANCVCCMSFVFDSHHQPQQYGRLVPAASGVCCMWDILYVVLSLTATISHNSTDVWYQRLVVCVVCRIFSMLFCLWQPPSATTVQTSGTSGSRRWSIYNRSSRSGRPNTNPRTTSTTTSSSPWAAGAATPRGRRPSPTAPQRPTPRTLTPPPSTRSAWCGPRPTPVLTLRSVCPASLPTRHPPATTDLWVLVTANRHKHLLSLYKHYFHFYIS